LHILLGVALFETTGLAEESGAAFAKALEIAESIDDVGFQLRALWGMCMHRLNNAETRAARPLAQRFCLLAKRTNDGADALVGDRLIGRVMHEGGNQPEARHHLERIVNLYVAPADGRHTLWFLYDQRVLARSTLARVLCLQGFADQAMRNARASVEDGRVSDHIPSLCYAVGAALCPVAIMVGDYATAEQSLKMLANVATKHNLMFWTKLLPCLEGALLVEYGDVAHGSNLLKAALDTSERTGLAVHFSGFFGYLAEGLARSGRAAEALAIVEKSLDRYDLDGVAWQRAELLRVRGELLLQEEASGSTAAAEDCFLTSLGVAREQGALFWELRSALSLAGLRVQQNRKDDARQTLKPLYDRFTEGFETADLRAARVMLQLLPPG
jgi:tetratricopeptide (TPR) repeat protein